MIYYNANTRKRFTAIIKHPNESHSSFTSCKWELIVVRVGDGELINNNNNSNNNNESLFHQKMKLHILCYNNTEDKNYDKNIYIYIYIYIYI